MPEEEASRYLQLGVMRLALDEHVNALRTLPRTREIALAITKLEEARMWLGVARYAKK